MSCRPANSSPKSDQRSVRAYLAIGGLGVWLFCCAMTCTGKAEEKLDIKALAAKGDVSRIRKAVEAGAKINQPDVNGYTPLAVAAFNGQLEAASALLDLGADPQAGVAPLRALSLAIGQADLAMVRLLIERGALVTYPLKEDQPLSFATDPQIITFLVESGADVNLQGGIAKETSLHRSASMANVAAIKALLALGADPKLANSSGWTPLHNLCRIRNVELLPGAKERIRTCMRLLLKAGADPNALDTFLSTPLHQAARSSVMGIEELKLLVASGSKLDIKNGAGRTPAMVAQFNGFSYDKPRLEVLSGGNPAYLSK